MNSLVEEPAQAKPPRAGFALPRDILIAPARAYASIMARPEWVPAAIVVLLLSAIGTVLIAPSIAHITNAAATAISAPGTRMTAQAVDSAIKDELVQVFFQQTFQQIAEWSLTAMVLTTAARLRGQPTSFATYFSLAANCGITTALGFALQAALIGVHDPASYVNFDQLNTAFPLNLAVLDPHGTPVQIAFLAQFDIFFLWTCLLVAYGYMAISGEKPLRALFLSFGISLSLSLLLLALQPTG